MRFFGPNLQTWCTVQPLHQCKMPQEKRRKCTLSIKMSPASGGFPPDPLTRGSALDPARGSATDPRYRLALRARHGPVQTQLLIVQY